MAADFGDDRSYRFGEFSLDIGHAALMHSGIPVPLRPKSFAMLRYFLEHPDRIITHQELFTAIWGATIVTDDAITQCVIDIRRALGDSSRTIIRTVPRHGYILTLPVEVIDATPSARLGRPSSFVTVGLTLAVFAALVWLTETNSGNTWDHISDRTIAVLPFVDVNPAANQEHFADSIAGEILNLLSQLPELQVIARTSSFLFRKQNADVPAIATALGVAWILEGSVRRSGDRVHVTARLIDASDSLVRWSETYDRELADVLAIQTEIAASVASAMQVRKFENSLAPTLLSDFSTYGPYLHGRFLYDRRAPGDLEKALTYFEQALAIDPHYAPAWAGLSGVYFIQALDSPVVADASWEKMKQAFERALFIDPHLGDALVRATQYYAYHDDEVRADEYRRQALEHAPINPLVLSSAAGYNFQHGRVDLAIEQQEVAVRFDAFSVVNHGNLAEFLTVAGRYEEAEREILMALDLNPDDHRRYEIAHCRILILDNRSLDALPIVESWPGSEVRDQQLAMIYHAVGEPVLSDAALAELRQRTGADTNRLVAEVYAFRGEIDSAFQELSAGAIELFNHRNVACDRRNVEFCMSPYFTALRADPRWNSLLKPIDKST